jgi:hypothetical protein
VSREVMIDGVRYVPATDAAINMEAVIRGLLMSYWGVVAGPLDEAMSDVHVYVNDNCTGVPIQSVLADIAAELVKKVDDTP